MIHVIPLLNGVSLLIISVLFLSLLFAKDKEIVDYIVRQRKEGHVDGKIRTKMEIHGHTPENLNLYFQLADEQTRSSKVLLSSVSFVLVVLVLGGLFVTAQNTGITAAVTSTVTGAVSWGSFSLPSFFGSSSYECGDDYPANSDDVMDLSNCVTERDATKNYLFCYANNSVTSNEISPDGSNNDWYLTNVKEDVSLITSIDTMSLLESSIVFPWTAFYDNVDCFSWDHGITRREDWHLCNATESGAPPNMVFYYTDVADGKNVSYGGLSTSLVLNSSYYLCYDELECTTERSACNEDAGSYCVGRLDSTAGSNWYPCDTTLDASYYRCCTGGCNAKEMMCGEYVGADTRSAVEFNECSSDGTSSCCSEATDCVYNAECYSEDETITYQTMGLAACNHESGCTTGSGVTEYTFVCSDEHWCPNGFSYDDSSGIGICVPRQAACYDASDSEYCNYVFGTDNTDDWEADTNVNRGCIRPDPDSVVYNESCLYSGTYGGMDYYFYQDITWY